MEKPAKDLKYHICYFDLLSFYEFFWRKKINALPFRYKVADEKSCSKVAHFHQAL